MGSRRNAREWALQFLFQSEYNRAASLEEGIQQFWKDMDAVSVIHALPATNAPASEAGSPEDIQKARKYATELIQGVLQHYPEIDEQLADISEHWRIDRMGAVERNIMRIAVYEMLYRADIPGPVAINEAVTLAKVFSSIEASRFVNGLLDQVLRNVRNARGESEPGAAPKADG